MKTTNLLRLDAQAYLTRPSWYVRIIERFDLVPLRDVATELAYPPGELLPNEAMRAAAMNRLLDAIQKGEFGDRKPAVVWLPEDVTAARPGRLRLRPSRGAIALWRAHTHPCLAELWAPRRLIRLWFERRSLPLPPWLSPPPPATGHDKPIYRTGLAGKPSSWHLVETELRRRWGAGERHLSAKAWASVLAQWLQSEHPEAPRATAKTLREKLAPLLRELGRR